MNKSNPTVQFIIKNRKTICTFLIILLLFELLVVYLMVQQYKENYLSRPDAIAAVMEKTGLSTDQVTDLDSDFETENGTAWFEITFVHDGTEYLYKVDAKSGEVTDLKE